MSKHINLFDLIINRVKREPASSSSIIWNEREISWKNVEMAARKVAGGLIKLGIRSGDRVAVMLPNTLPYIFIQHGILLAGAIVVPVHIFTRSTELGYLLDDSESKVLFAWNGYSDEINEAAAQTESLRYRIEIGSESSENVFNFESWLLDSPSYDDKPIGGGDDIATIRYTAGVTGRPKGAMISHENILYSSNETLKSLKVRSQDKILTAIPFYHPFGNTLQLYLALRSNASMILQTRFDPIEAIEAISDGKVSVLIGLPIHFTSIIEAEGYEGEIGKLSFAVCGGGPLDHSATTRFESMFSTRLATVYGTCETSPTIAVNPSHIEETAREALGRPISGMEIRIADENNADLNIEQIGEIQVRGKGVFKGYWNRPDATEIAIDEDGWFHTSDLGRIDIDGFLFGVGRFHDRINKGGFSVYPREVEGILNAHPSVYASAVIGVPDPRMGEDIIAYVVARGGEPVDENDLIEYCQEYLSRYKAPSRIYVIDRLPRSPSGVILRRALRDQWKEEKPAKPETPVTDNVSESAEPAVEENQHDSNQDDHPEENHEASD